MLEYILIFTYMLPPIRGHNVFKGLRPVLEGFVVTMHEGVLFAQAWVHGDNQPRQIGLNHDYNMTFSISPREC